MQLYTSNKRKERRVAEIYYRFQQLRGLYYREQSIYISGESLHSSRMLSAVKRGHPLSRLTKPRFCRSISSKLFLAYSSAISAISKPLHKSILTAQSKVRRTYNVTDVTVPAAWNG
jgi:hypothetical protein